MKRFRLLIAAVACCCPNLLMGQPASGDDSSPRARQTTPIKNVLLIVADDLKASVLGCYGNPVCRTPNLDRLASRGTIFQRAYCQGTWCAPSRISFMHSRYKDSASPSLGAHLQEHGWYTARVGKIFHMRVPGDIIAGTNGRDEATCWTERFNSPGLEAHTPGAYACLNLNIFTRAMENRQSTRMRHRMFVSVKSDSDGSLQADHKSATKAIELLGEQLSGEQLSGEQREKPFFLAVGMVRPHYPMVAPGEDFAPYSLDRISMPGNWTDDIDDIPRLGKQGIRNDNNPIGKYPENQKRMWAAYYASVSFMDRQVGRVLRALETSPHRDNTAVIFTSDHGYHLGEHGLWQKSNLHEEVIRVPLLIHVPGQEPASSESIVELVDLYPTVCDLVDAPIPAAAQGTSLLPVITDPATAVKDAALSFNRGTSLRTQRWHYMRYQDGSEELYDCQTDPEESSNLIGDASHSETLRQLRRQLDRRERHLTGRNTQR